MQDSVLRLVPPFRRGRIAPLAGLVLVLATALAVAQEPAAVTDGARRPPDPASLQPLPEHRQKGFDSIDPELCRQWLTYLASDELEGRATGRRGYRLAAEFVAARFAEWGLKPVGDDGTYFQNVPFAEVMPDRERSYLAAVAADGVELFRIGIGYGVGGSLGEAADESGELVVVDGQVGDADHADLAGKVVLVQTDDRRAIWQLMRAQPAALLAVADDDAAAVRSRISLDTGGRDRVRNARGRFPNRYSVSAAVAGRLREAAAANPGMQVAAHVEIARQPVFAANVVGLLEGSDPALAGEIVGVGSHLDHVGVSDRGEIRNGADDDGSGTTGVLAVVRAFHENGVMPRRSILFMCFAGEEMGLVGSRHYTANPIFPNESMIAEIQMDMIGRREEAPNPEERTPEAADDNVNTLHLVGTRKASDELHEICLAVNERHVGFVFEYDQEGMFGRSDHANFAAQDIPVAFLFTGLHPQYHQPDDTVDKIDFPKLARVAKLAYALAFELADRDVRPKVDRTWEEVGGRRGRRR